MHVKLVAITQSLIRREVEPLTPLTPEEHITYCARVSNPNNQLNTDTASKLLGYCIRNKHWSIFEQVNFTVEIRTSRAIAAQILRHRSFTFQEFSQRYAAVGTGSEPVELRLKAGSNRQGSGDKVAGEYLSAEAQRAVNTAEVIYEKLIQGGVAPECARMVLPLCTSTTLYMNGSVRSWIHYLEQRTSSHAQKEHRLVALEIEKIFNQQFPAIAEALKPAAQ
jgi:thymidylate synthase (FAD)